MAAIYLQCREACGATTRVEKLGPVTQITNSFHCPVCGAPARYSANQDMDYWYVLATSIGLPETQEGVAIVKAIYAEWDTNEYSKFKDYVEAIKSGS